MRFFDRRHPRRPRPCADELVAATPGRCATPAPTRSSSAKPAAGKSSGPGDHACGPWCDTPIPAGRSSPPSPRTSVRQRVFREERTLDDLYILEPGGDARFNVLDYERAHGADVPDLTQACMTFKETLTRTEGGGGGRRRRQRRLFRRPGADDAPQRHPGPAAGHRPHRPLGHPVLHHRSGHLPGRNQRRQWKESYHYQTLQEAKAKAHERTNGTTSTWPSNTGRSSSPGQRPHAHQHRGRRHGTLTP